MGTVPFERKWGMHIRTIAVCLAAGAALVAAGCGDDDDDNGGDNGASTQQQSATPRPAEGGELKDIEPRTAAPNLVGGRGPIQQFVTTAATDSISYWQKVFQSSGLAYRGVTVNVLNSPTQTCGRQFDPASQPFFLCANPNGSEISLGAPVLNDIRASSGDGAVAFLTGYAIAMDTNDQLSGNPISEGSGADATFYQRTACFTGAWIRNVADRSILEAGDDQEVLDAAERYVQGSNAQITNANVRLGYQEGAAACQQKIGGFSEDGSTTTTG